MNDERFKAACDAVIGAERERNGIGTLGEKTLHAVLKRYYEPHECNHEVRLGSYIADIVGENGVIEIQTRQFGNLLKKLECFLEFCSVTVVYPIAGIKYLSWIDTDTGEVTSRRKSPKKGNIYDALPELYRIKYTLDNPNMHLRLCILELEETRYLNGWSRDKKRGSSRCDRIPVRMIEEVCIDSPQDHRMFIPEGLPEEYTSRDLSKAAKIPLDRAQTALNLLTYLGLTEKIGKKGKLILYKTVI